MARHHLAGEVEDQVVAQLQHFGECINHHHLTQPMGHAPGSGVRQASHSTSAMPPNCSTAPGKILPVMDHTPMLRGPRTTTAPAFVKYDHRSKSFVSR